MAKKFEILPTITLSKTPFIAPPKVPEMTHLEDHALDMMVDFLHAGPSTVDMGDFIEDALIEAKTAEGSTLLVLGPEHQVRGVISSEDIQGEKPYKLMQELRVKRTEIRVRAIMTPIESVVAFEYESLRHARVGDVIKTLTDAKLHYALVVDSNENHQGVRGLFSASQISRALGTDVTGELSEAHSIMELKRGLDSND